MVEGQEVHVADDRKDSHERDSNKDDARDTQRDDSLPLDLLRRSGDYSKPRDDLFPSRLHDPKK